MVIFLLGVSVIQFLFFLFATAWVSRHDGLIWIYVFNVIVATAGIVVGFLNIFGVSA